MQIELTNNFRLDIISSAPDVISFRLYQAGSDRFGHGWLLRSVTQLKDEQLDELKAAMTLAEEPAQAA